MYIWVSMLNWKWKSTVKIHSCTTWRYTKTFKVCLAKLISIFNKRRRCFMRLYASFSSKTSRLPTNLNHNYLKLRRWNNGKTRPRKLSKQNIKRKTAFCKPVKWSCNANLKQQFYQESRLKYGKGLRWRVSKSARIGWVHFKQSLNIYDQF
jgi:hypothetical protein